MKEYQWLEAPAPIGQMICANHRASRTVVEARSTLSSQHLGVARGQYKAHVTTFMHKSSPQHMASSRMRRSVSSGSQSSWSIRILVRRVTVVLPAWAAHPRFAPRATPCAHTPRGCEGLRSTAERNASPIVRPTRAQHGAARVRCSTPSSASCTACSAAAASPSASCPTRARRSSLRRT
jgi:hypothetical protein